MCDAERNVAIFAVDPRTSPHHESFVGDLATQQLVSLGRSLTATSRSRMTTNLRRFCLLTNTPLARCDLLSVVQRRCGACSVLQFCSTSARRARSNAQRSGRGAVHRRRGTASRSLSLHNDHYGLTYLRLDAPDQVQPVTVQGAVHKGSGELVDLKARLL